MVVTRSAPPERSSGGEVNPAAIDAALRAIASQRPALTWMGFLQVTRLQGDTLELSPRPGRREIMAFAGPQRCEQLRDLLRDRLGVNLRVSITAPSAAAGVGVEAPAASGQDRAREMNRGPSAAQRQAALNGPLVKQVTQVFDVTFLGVDAIRDTPAAPATGADHVDIRPVQEPEEPGLDLESEQGTEGQV
jgi:hypothetical protein